MIELELHSKEDDKSLLSKEKAFAEIFAWIFASSFFMLQKQLSRGVPRKRCSENIQQIHGRTPMPITYVEALRHGCFPVTLLSIFRTPFPRNIPGRPLLMTPALNYYFVVWRTTLTFSWCFVSIYRMVRGSRSRSFHICEHLFYRTLRWVFLYG